MTRSRAEVSRLLPGCLAALVSLAGCAGTLPAPAPAPAGSGTPSSAPWNLPAADLATQRLFRVTYDGPDGEGSFRLTLRLAGAARYRAQASDPLGRPLWSLDVDGDAGLWLDHRERSACTLAGRFDLAAARLAPFPLSSLPALLLGRVPAAPAGAVERGAGRAELGYRDAAGRRWSVRLDAAGQPASWTLWRDGEPAVWWRAAAAGGRREATLSDRRRGTQLRWRQVVREALGDGGLTAAAVPEGYATVDCAALYGAGGDDR